MLLAIPRNKLCDLFCLVADLGSIPKVDTFRQPLLGPRPPRGQCGFPKFDSESDSELSEPKSEARDPGARAAGAARASVTKPGRLAS